MHVTFKTDLFNHTERKPHFINPDCFGEDLAAWLIDHMGRENFQLGGPIQEDYGWGFWTHFGRTPYWTAISLYDRGGDMLAEWVVTVVYEPGCFIVMPMHRPRRADLLALCDAIDRALHDEPRIIEIRWWRKDIDVGESTPHPE